jgi:hypothetical protein
MEVRQVGAGNGWNWVVDGFGLFRKSPVIWIALFLIYVLIAMALSTIKVLGPILLNLLAPVFMAGFMLGCKALDEGDELEINHLFAGFKQHTSGLITVGGIYLAGIIVIVGVVFIATGNAALLGQSPGQDDPASLAENGKLLLVMLTALAAIVPLVMAYWFAPALVAFHDIKPVEAMKLSFHACLRNMLPFLVYSLISMLLMLLAMLPLGLGLLVMIPTITTSLYASYKDIFNPPSSAGGEITA